MPTSRASPWPNSERDSVGTRSADHLLLDPHPRKVEGTSGSATPTTSGSTPNPDALLHLSGCVLIEAHDEWQDSGRRYLSEKSMALLQPPEPTAIDPRRDTPSQAVDQPQLQTA